jgi:L-aminopeptidase/D-esterase-like protein
MAPHANLITDVGGLRVGNSHDERLASGVTVVIPDEACVACVDVRGAATGTRDTETIGLAGTVSEVHAIVLSGGSAFGLQAASGVQTWLAERGIGFPIGPVRVPIVPQAILFDLLNGGDKSWGHALPYEALARAACKAAERTFALGSEGAGFGATTANLRGGLGSASQALERGLVVGALAAVNPVGVVTIGDGPHFWAAPFERNGEFGGLGFPPHATLEALAFRLKGTATRPVSTTIAVVATNARLTTREAHRLAVMAQTGLARAIYPVHTPLDGDTVFALATGAVALRDPLHDLARLGATAANVLARAVARGVYEAAPAPPGWTGPPAYRECFARSPGRSPANPA